MGVVRDSRKFLAHRAVIFAIARLSCLNYLDNAEIDVQLFLDIKIPSSVVVSAHLEPHCQKVGDQDP